MKRKILPIIGISAIILCYNFMPAWSNNETISKGKTEIDATGTYDHIEVRGIVQGTKPIALVNGKMVKEGDWIDRAKVLRIGNDSVTFELDDHIFTKRVGVKISDYGSDEAKFIIPVLVVNYFPVEDGKIRTKKEDLTLDMARSTTLSLVYNVIDALEKGSTYHGYKDPKAKPSLKYQVLETLEFRKPLPTLIRNRTKIADYQGMMKDIDIQKWVEDKRVKEVWICYQEDTSIQKLWESNMSSRFGDVSNSDRNQGDLPVLRNTTYTVYNYNYQREDACAVENHMHQIEVVLKYVDRDFFDNKFVGKLGEGRCGWSHCPPNAESDYDWLNKRYVESDIEDWRPEGGITKLINSSRWGNTAMGWFIFWMQNLPGEDNGITYHGRPLRNWWVFIGDFDRAVKNHFKLVM